MNILKRLFSRDRELSCRQTAAVLQQYLDSELDPNQVPKVLAHLEKCRTCGLEAEMYQRIKDSLRAHQQAPSVDSVDKMRALAQQLATSGPPEGLVTDAG